MKFINKTISVFLTLSVMLSMCIMPIKAEGEIKVQKLSETGIAAERLNALGVFTNAEMEQDATSAATRADFVTWLIKALNLTNIKSSNTHYADVPADYWAADAINLACDMGYISEAENFDPARAVKYDEAIKMIVSAIGYEPLASSQGGYPSGYRVAAQIAEVTKNVPAAIGGIVSKATAAGLLDNMLDADIMHYENGALKKSGGTVLSSKHGIVIYDAVITNVDLQFRQITINVDGSEIQYGADVKVDLNSIVQDDAKVYVKDKETIVYVYQKGNVRVLNDYIYRVDKLKKYGDLARVSEIDEIELRNEGETYRADKEIEVWVNNELVDNNDEVSLTGTFAKVYLFDDKVRKIEAWELREGGIIQKSNEIQINFTKGEQPMVVFEDMDRTTDLRIFVDGIECPDMYSMKRDMMFDYWCNADKTEYVFVASGRHYWRTLDSATNRSIIFEGKQYGIDSRYGVYVWSVTKERFIKDASLLDLYGKQVEVFADDNMCVRYIKIREDALEATTFLGVVEDWDCKGRSETDPGTLSIYKISGGDGLATYPVSKKIKRESDNKNNDFLTLEYVRSKAANLNGEGFFKFTVNKEGEIIRAEIPDMWGHSFDLVSQRISKTNSYYLNTLYVRAATLFMVFEDYGEFMVKKLDWDKHMRGSWGPTYCTVKVVSDYDALYNPLPDYVMLTGANMNKFAGNDSKLLLTDIQYLPDNQVKCFFPDSYGGKTYTMDLEKIEKFEAANPTFEFKENIYVNVKYGMLGKYGAEFSTKQLSSNKDWSGPSSGWANDNATKNPLTESGFYKVDKVLYSDDTVAQFMINGEPTAVLEWYEWASVFDYSDGDFTIKTVANNPLAYAIEGDYNVWVQLSNMKENPIIPDGYTGTNQVALVVMEKK